MIGRVVNVMIPRQLGIVTDELTGDGNEPRIPLVYLVDCSKNAMGKFTCLRLSSIHARKYGSCRSYQVIRMDPNRPGILLFQLQNINKSIPTANYPREHLNTFILFH